MAETTHTQTETKTSTSKPEALDVPTLELEELVRPAEDGYIESEDHRPEPLYQYGTVDTTDSGGGVHGNVHEASPVFAVARAQNLITAAKALDPKDPTPRELVTLPEGSLTVTNTAKTAEEGREEIADALRDLAENPAVLGAGGPQLREAGEEHEASVTEDKDNDGKPDALERDKGTGSEHDPARQTGQTSTESVSTTSSTPGPAAGEPDRSTGTATRRSTNRKS